LAFSYWIDYLGFLQREKLAAIFIKPCSWGFQLAGHLLHQLHASKTSQVFWYRYRGLKKKNHLYQDRAIKGMFTYWWQSTNLPSG
jgi:hypothetical protein